MCSLVRYQVEHSKRYPVSTSRHVSQSCKKCKCNVYVNLVYSGHALSYSTKKSANCFPNISSDEWNTIFFFRLPRRGLETGFKISEQEDRVELYSNI